MSDDGAAALDLSLAFARHLLAVADDVAPAEVEALALSKYPAAVRTEPDVLTVAPGRHLSGPFTLDGDTRRELGLPAWVQAVYLLTCPVDRGGPVPAPLADLGGLLGAFADAAVQGVEREALDLVLAMSRRLSGVVRTSTGHLLHPREWAGVDLSVYAPVWLYPDALVHVLEAVLPGVHLPTDREPEPQEGPEGDQGEAPAGDGEPADLSRDGAGDVDGVRDLDPGERAWLHAEADAFDAYTLSQPEVLEAYGALWHYPGGGVIVASLAAAERLPTALAGLDWAGEEGVMVYEVRWHAADPQQWQEEPVPASLRAECEDARVRIEDVARALLEAVGGQAVDDDDFLVQP